MDRRAFERWLETTVREHRFTIAVVFPVVGAVILLTSAEGLLPRPLAFNPLLLLIGIAVMRVPLVAGILPLIGARAGFVLVVLAAYTWGIEMVGVATGYPYGAFEYGVHLGPMALGIPAALPLLFVPLVVNAYLLTLILAPWIGTGRVTRIGVAVGLVVGIDLVLDPAAVALGFWTFGAEGAYYGVPWSNYAGWLLSGTVAVLAVELAFSTADLRERLGECEFILDDLISFTLLWGTINLVYGHAIPVMIALGFAAALYRGGRLDVLGLAPSAAGEPG